MLSVCYALSNNAEQADRLWWEMPLCKLWAMLHCHLYQQGQNVKYSKQINKYRNLFKRNDKHKDKRPAYERNLEEVEYIR